MRRAGYAPLALAALGLMLATTFSAAAQPSAATVPDDVVRKMMELGLKNIHRALCDGFNQCAAATPGEFEIPPLTIDQARAAMMVGARSAFARWCGFDADRRSVLPFMGQLRRSKLYNERQLALIAVIHGIQQSVTVEQLKSMGECDAASRTKIEGQLPKS